MNPLDYPFRRLAFLQILLGILAFCIAEGRPVLLALVGALAVISWFYTESGGRRGISRQGLNFGALGAVMLLTLEVRLTGASQPVALVGHFTMSLQVILLFAQKGRREYLQLIALSALQMLSGSVLPGGITLIYGLLLLVYCILALLTALTFQLKSCGDLVHERQKSAAPLDEAPAFPEPVGGPRQRWHFRWTAAALGLFCVVCAVLVFIAAPRSKQDGLAVALSRPAGSAQSQAGFSSTINLGGGAIGTGSPEPVLNLRVKRNGVTVGGEDRPWLLRGAVLDQYEADTQSWVRSHQNATEERVIEAGDRGLRLANLSGQPIYDATITLRRISQQNLFVPTAVEGPVATTYLRVSTQKHIQFNIEDQQLMSLSPSSRVQEYGVQLPVQPQGDIRELYKAQLPDQVRVSRDTGWRGPGEADSRGRFDFRSRGTRFGPASEEEDERYVRAWSVEVDRVGAMARSILSSAGLPTDLSNADAATRRAAVRALARYLRLNFTYTTDNPKSAADDPVIGFLFLNRAGHCELFASGLAALCRCVGLPARLVTGFRAAEYNEIGDYYVVRQQHAHAWAEVDLGPGHGWYTIDATPASAVDQLHFARSGGLLGSLRSLYDHLEFNWIATIITYDKRAQEELLGAISSFITAGPDSWVGSARAWVDTKSSNLEIDQVGYIMMVLISVVLMVALFSLIRTLILRHRRMVALQLTALPRHQRRQLARQLRFYITMLEVLERYGWERPHWQSPYRFARDLAEQDQLRFEPVVSLTELFYEVRFGHRSLDDLRRQQVRAHLRRLETTLSGSAD
ncbi:MAG: DUF3488 and transglutaminase-like domain-containing protein [Planctomycetota bacterium]